MLEGFLIGLAIWTGPAILAWLASGLFQIGRHQH